MDLQLKGLVAVVTGASRGIGRATALAFASEGSTVVAVSRGTPTDAVEGIEHLSLDLAADDAPAQMIEHVMRRYGRLDILVNNVGHATPSTGFLDESLDEWARLLNLNLLSAVRAMRCALPPLAVRGGVIVNVSSVNARLPSHQAAAYSATKAALLNVGKNLATEYASKNVRVVTISPGVTATPLWLGPDGAAARIAAREGTTLDQVVQRVGDSMPLRRFITPKEVADCICFLASPRASAVTGTELMVDGGLFPAA